MGNRISVILLPLVLSASSAFAQDAETWTWNKVVPAGRAIEIKGVNGDVVATATPGREVRVVARKTGNRSDVSDVEMRVVEHEGGVTICAVYPAPRGRPENECLPGARGRSNTQNNDVDVDFEVQVPRGLDFTARTVNGSVRATSLTGDVDAHTVNGSVRVETTGAAQAATVNGSVTVRMGRSDWRDDLRFATVNGAIVLELPDPLNTEFSATTVNGSIESDWPIRVTGRFGPRRASGTIGTGGRQLELTTVNGDIELRRAN